MSHVINGTLGFLRFNIEMGEIDKEEINRTTSV